LAGVSGPSFVGLPPGQAEVGDANPTVLIDEDICRLQIAMNDASLVCIMNRARDVADDRCRFRAISGPRASRSDRLSPST
jgi:hypothetical protein